MSVKVVVSEKVISKVLYIFLYKKNHDPYKNFKNVNTNFLKNYTYRN